MRVVPPLACAQTELEFALSAAVAREDYAEAARIKKEMDKASQLDEERGVRKEVERQTFLLDGDSIDKMLASAGSGVVVLHFTAAEHSMANGMVERVASKYAGSQIAGGTPVAFVQLSDQGVLQLGKAKMFTDPRTSSTASPPPPPSSLALPAGWKEATDPKTGRPYYISPTKQTTWERPLTETARAAQKLFAEREILSLPKTQIWRDKALVKEVGSMTLEAALVELGARPVTGLGSNVRTGNERLRDREQGTGMPSATAVDDIDFTGGKAGYGGTAFNTKFNDRGKTTGDYLPDLRDKPGDDMGADGYPNSPSDRKDVPPGGGGP
ncbi:MAG: hypothetical protein SGPRY_000120 [Prymnesium sp.]